MLKRDSKTLSCIEIERNMESYKRKSMNHWMIDQIIRR